jgi:hypothetical protein
MPEVQGPSIKIIEGHAVETKPDGTIKITPVEQPAKTEPTPKAEPKVEPKDDRHVALPRDISANIEQAMRTAETRAAVKRPYEEKGFTGWLRSTNLYKQISEGRGRDEVNRVSSVYNMMVGDPKWKELKAKADSGERYADADLKTYEHAYAERVIAELNQSSQ